MIITCLTPNNQITIPRAVMKSLDIRSNSELSFEVSNGIITIKKIDAKHEDNKHEDKEHEDNKKSMIFVAG